MTNMYFEPTKSDSMHLMKYCQYDIHTYTYIARNISCNFKKQSDRFSLNPIQNGTSHNNSHNLTKGRCR